MLQKSSEALANKKWQFLIDIFPSKFTCRRLHGDDNARMFSHVVIFWTDPAKPDAADEVIAGANKYLKTIPGLTHFHIGKMIGSARPVVDQTYQVALNTVFTTKQAQDDYQIHPQHLEFIAQYVKPFVKKVVVYDFE
jgi:Stress responsive A/B Barrel Domain